MNKKRFAALFLTVPPLILIVAFYLGTFHPKTIEQAKWHCETNTPLFNPTDSLKVLNYNVQYFAGKDYVFFYDLPDGDGPDHRPSSQSIATTVEGIAELIDQHNPDVVLLQEVHENHVSTDHQDQTQQLLDALSTHYPCMAEALYWKASFVPHPAIMGSAGMKLVTLSKYRMEYATRHQLSLIPGNPISQAFNLKRAVLQVGLTSHNKAPVTLFNTHLDAFSQGTDTMTKQVAEVKQLIDGQQNWVLGGDFNLLPPGQFETLPSKQQYYYNPNTELADLWNQYPSVPSPEQVQKEPEAWFTHFPNDPSVGQPDRTIDYVFYHQNWRILESEVVPAFTLSDHLPIVAELILESPILETPTIESSTLENNE